MKLPLAITFATLYGMSLRIMFGLLNSFMGIMSISFLILVPVIIGFFTIILTPIENTKSSICAFFKPWITCLVILVITVVFNIEGTICWILIYPLFSILAGIGGVIAYNIGKRKSSNSKSDDWEKPGMAGISILLFLPCFLGLAEGDRSLTHEEFNISRSILISSPTKKVWKVLTNIDEITDGENTASFANLVGFPKHIRTTLDTLAIGGKRMAIYEKGLYFDETIANYEPEKKLVLDIKTDPNKIPPTVMDEHIVIGGKHVDILQDVYKIEKISETSSRLTLSSRFFINTPFNWYVSVWAKYLMSDILQGELNLVAARATAKESK